MQTERYPYGPEVPIFDSVIAAVSQAPMQAMTHADLERAGVRKSALSLTLAGLRLLGFLDESNRPTGLCVAYADPASRQAACLTILSTTYPSLAEVLLITSDNAHACFSYLHQTGRKLDSVRKIMKVFVHIWAGAYESKPRLRRIAQRPQATTDVRFDPMFPPDQATLDLVMSLERYCADRDKLLQAKRAELAALQQAAAEVAAYISGIEDDASQKVPILTISGDAT